MKSIPSGDKSEVLDVDSPDLEQFPEFVKAKRYECVLEPGDLLFIPGRCSYLRLVPSGFTNLHSNLLEGRSALL